MTGGKIFLDSVGGGAWPFLVGGMICLFNYDNERDDHGKLERLIERSILILLFQINGLKPFEMIAITGL